MRKLKETRLTDFFPTCSLTIVCAVRACTPYFVFSAGTGRLTVCAGRGISWKFWGSAHRVKGVQKKKGKEREKNMPERKGKRKKNGKKGGQERKVNQHNKIRDTNSSKIDSLFEKKMREFR